MYVHALCVLNIYIMFVLNEVIFYLNIETGCTLDVPQNKIMWRTKLIFLAPKGLLYKR